MTDRHDPGYGAGASSYSRLGRWDGNDDRGDFFDRDEYAEPPAAAYRSEENGRGRRRAHEPEPDPEPQRRSAARERRDAGRRAPAVPTRADEQPPRTSRAGRNVPVSIVVGIALVIVVLGTLFFAQPLFLLVLIAAGGIGTWELVRAISSGEARPALLPLLGGGAVIIALAWFSGLGGLSLGLLIAMLAAFVWRLGDGPDGYQRDMGASTLILVYVPFLLGFAALLARADRGDWRVFCLLAAVVLSDTGGFVAGVFFGKHPMAPTISPKKSWEGFAGSIIATTVGSAVALHLALDLALWKGAVFGVGVSIACVLGDLAESLLKRDLKIKDMSNLLPGHGGLMDRLDSIVFALPVAYVLLNLMI